MARNNDGTKPGKLLIFRLVSAGHVPTEEGRNASDEVPFLMYLRIGQADDKYPKTLNRFLENRKIIGVRYRLCSRGRGLKLV